MSRSIVLGIDESPEQTQRIIQQQNKKLAGLTDEVATRKAKELLQNCMRILKPYEVVNRYADKIQLPVEAKMLRRLNNHYQSFVSQITILHQYQRQKDEQGRLIATVEDLKLACEILFDAIMWKIDELDSSLRQVFEQMKDYVRKQGNAHPFTAREIRQQLNLSKSQCFRYIEELKKLEYIQASEGSANRGFRYTIAYFDNMQMTREKVKTGLMEQLSRL
jgi:DNA-binding IscR family transcriptional regulator